MGAEPDALSASGTAKFFDFGLKMMHRQEQYGVIPGKEARLR